MKKYIVLFISIVAVFASACNSSEQKGQPENYKQENLTVLCDDGCYEMMSKVITEYDSINITLNFNLKQTPAFDCMANLLAGNAKAVIVSREFSKYEDSLMKVYNVKPYRDSKIAHDALVFYTNINNPIDSITDAQLCDIFTNTSSTIQKYYPSCGINEYVCNSQLSSEYYNFKKYILKNKISAVKLKEFSTCDSALKYVASHYNSIGIGYLSQLHGRGDLKALPISFVDSTGKYIFPHTVHQANIVQGFYPYKITHYIYLFDTIAEAPLALARYMSKSANSQKFFNNYGIVPAFANIKLRIEE